MKYDITDLLKQVRALIANSDDFLMVAEKPDPGYRDPSTQHPTGQWAFPMAIGHVSGWDRHLTGQIRKAIIADLPWHIRWMRVTVWWCPPLWYVAHATAIATLDRAISNALREGETT